MSEWDKIKKGIEIANLSLVDLSELTKIHRSTFKRWDNGDKPSPVVLEHCDQTVRQHMRDTIVRMTDYLETKEND